MVVEKWQSHFPGELSDEGIRTHFVPADKYRISRYSYPAGTVFNGAMMSGCAITFGSDSVTINENEFAKVPAGSYTLQVDQQKAVELMLVWELPIIRETQS
jgi:hypothetical protein